jgi:3-oxoacyl-[acyl-carrier protein] reductase
MLAARDEEALARAAADTELDWISIDLTELRAPARAIEACVARFGQIWALVSAAGASSVRPLLEASETDWREQWELDVMVPRGLIRAAAPYMKQRGGGRIVIIGSSSGRRPSSRDAPYSVSKAAQLALARVAAQNWHNQGVLVNAISPGPVATELWTSQGGLASQLAERQGASPRETFQAVADRIPIRRFGTPEEIAAVAVLLCSERFATLTGANWAVDGGNVPYVSSFG